MVDNKPNQAPPPTPPARPEQIARVIREDGSFSKRAQPPRPRDPQPPKR